MNKFLTLQRSPKRYDPAAEARRVASGGGSRATAWARGPPCREEGGLTPRLRGVGEGLHALPPTTDQGRVASPSTVLGEGRAVGGEVRQVADERGQRGVGEHLQRRSGCG
eukprot:scaffold33817_cov78-Phaeocystis_antarctica.AAC.3